MKLYDSLSTNFKEINVSKVCIYTCGPTVYDYIHIGNARPLILTDTIIRFLEHKKEKYKYLLNITDIDDKIINRALEEGVDEKELAQKFTKEFLKDFDDLNIKRPTSIIPISSRINEIILFVDDLVKKGFAYESGVGVYFDISKWEKKYGMLSKQKIANLNVGERIDVDDNKKNPHDFILWKKTDVGKKWLSKWSLGRPGWHTECVLLIDEFFKHSIDIHVGGIDLKFPHHENERIQYMAKNSRELSHVWIHNGHLSIDNVKMSKSLKNTILVRDYLKDYGANSLRFIFLNSNYKQPLNITKEIIDQSLEWNQKIETMLKTINWTNAIGDLHLSNKTPIDDDFNSYKYITQFRNIMRSDLNTPLAISLIDEMCKSINKQIKVNEIDLTYAKIKIILETLGFKYRIKKLTSSDIENIKKWRELISKKDFFNADKLREKLKQENII